MNRYSYFLGCITPNRYPGIELATRKVLGTFDIEILDVEGASCCPAPGVFGSFDLMTWLVVAARNICIAEEMNSDIMVTCNGCYATLHEANYLLKQDDKLRDDVNIILKTVNREYKGIVKVKHVIEVLSEDIGYERIKQKLSRPLSGVKVAVHYGCHFLKPSEMRRHGSSERPTIIDDFVRALGAQSVSYKDKLTCCGAGGGVRAGSSDLALNYTRSKIENIVHEGADCVVTPCAFCHFQFDAGQVELSETQGKQFKLPVVYLTQLLGLALGMSSEDVGLDGNKTQVQSLLEKLRVQQIAHAVKK
jgi:heterodisulfide reductase subunit B